MSEIYQQSPLYTVKWLSDSQILPADAGIVLTEQALRGHVNLRGDPSNPAFCQAVASVLAMQLPLTPNTTSSTEDKTVLWLGPDEWLIITSAQQQVELITQLRDAGNQQDLSMAVTDLSSAQTIINVSGSETREMLAKGCPLDLHPEQFVAGQCAQTLLAKAAVVLWAESDDSINIIVRRSFAEYLWQWLKDASAEYGLAIV